MASLTTRGKTHYVIVGVKDEATGKYQHKWISFNDIEEAKAFKKNYEEEQERFKNEKSNSAMTVSHATRTVDQLIEQYVRLVGQEKWGVSTYPDYIARIDNYILPLIGKMRVWDCTVLSMDEYFAKLKTMPAVSQVGKEEKQISTRVLNEIHKFLKALFNQAIDWGMIEKNPCRKKNKTLPKHVPQKRPWWTRKAFFEASEKAKEIGDYMLLLAMHLSVSTSLRVGEIAALQWDRISVSDDDIAHEDCRVEVDCSLARVKKETIKKLNGKGIKFVFPDVFSASTSALVLKEPKSDTSNRTVWLPNTVAVMLRELFERQTEQKGFLGNAYHDYGLVIAAEDGRPIEGRVINDHLQALILQFNLPSVVFHSLRHTSTSYKLKIAQGDIKSVQGDTGHAQAQMVTEVYAEIMDEDRKLNAQRFEAEFYSTAMSNDEELVRDMKQKAPPDTTEILNAVAILQSNPELLQQLLAASMTSQK